AQLICPAQLSSNELRHGLLEPQLEGCPQPADHVLLRLLRMGSIENVRIESVRHGPCGDRENRLDLCCVLPNVPLNKRPEFIARKASIARVEVDDSTSQ